MPMSNEYTWKPINQTRCSHLVSKAIELFTTVPRPVQDLNLSSVMCRVHQDHRFVRCEDGVSCFFHEARLPAVSDGELPIIIASIRGRTFILDGAHRLAAWKLEGRVSIPSIRLSPEESEACIRPGMEKRVAQLNLDLPI
jgi:hypothetical protein